MSRIFQKYSSTKPISEDSSTKPISHGVPQGSVLGPLLFLIYINDLHTALSSKVFHFADDTNLLKICKSPKELEKSLNIDLKILYQWLLLYFYTNALGNDCQFVAESNQFTWW